MLKVCAKKCDQCLFDKDRIVSKDRMAEILQECRQNDSYFECHKGTIEGESIVCRGFYDTQTSQMIRIAQRLNAVKFVDPSAVIDGDEMFEPEND
jgi:hypothetical protein